MIRIAILVTALTLTTASLDANWEVFKAKHTKVYQGEEDVLRKYVWMSHLEMIEEHNELYAQGRSSFYMGENEYIDITTDEVRRKMNGIRVEVDLDDISRDNEPSTEGLPTAVDWRKKGYVTEVKNQGQCGSCWAFSTTGSLEGQHFKSTGKLVSLSESNLVDCSAKWGNNGCDGGLMDDAFQYVIDNKGIDTEMRYPYVPEVRPCHFKRGAVGATEKAFHDVQEGSENALQAAVATIGPISVAIDASHPSFQAYKGGVYDEPECSSTKLDHGVLVVGYGTVGGKDYWLVKNSWGPSWGEDGYIMMSRNKNNQCGIATMASYPVV